MPATCERSPTLAQDPTPAGAFASQAQPLLVPNLVRGDALEQGVGNPLPVSSRWSLRSSLRIGDEGTLHQDGGHGGGRQDIKRSGLDAAILHPKNLVQRRSGSALPSCWTPSCLASLPYRPASSFSRDSRSLPVAPLFSITRFSRWAEARASLSDGSRREIERLEAHSAPFVGGVYVKTDQEIRLDAIGKRAPFWERNEHVFRPRHQDADSEPLLEEAAQAQGPDPDHILFHEAAGANGPRVVSAMAGIQDDRQSGLRPPSSPVAPRKLPGSRRTGSFLCGLAGRQLGSVGPAHR